MVTAHCTCHTGGDGDDHQLRVNLLETGHHDGDEDTERAPRRARGKSQKHGHDKNDGRQEAHESAGRVLHHTGYISCRSQTVGHALQRPSKRQDQHGWHHLLEPFRQTIHAVAERQRLARQIVGNGDEKSCG